MTLIFDLDGTLFQAKPVVLLAIRRLLEQLEIPAPDEGIILKNAGGGAIEMLKGVLPNCMDAGAAMSAYYSQMRLAILERGALFPGAAEILIQLYNDGHELVLCSNSPMEYIELVLRHTDIAKYFSKLYSAEGCASKAEMIGKIVTPGAAAAVIGDTHGDVSAAHTNGLIAIAAMYGYGNKDMLKSADFFAKTPSDIVDCVLRSRSG